MAGSCSSSGRRQNRIIVKQNILGLPGVPRDVNMYVAESAEHNYTTESELNKELNLNIPRVVTDLEVVMIQTQNTTE